MGFFDFLKGKEKPMATPDANTGGGPEMMAPADVQAQQQVEAAEQGQAPAEVSPSEQAALDQMAAPEQSGGSGQ